MRKDGFTWTSCGFALIALLLSIPALVISFLGLNGSVDADGVAGALEEGVEATEMVLDNGACDAVGVMSAASDAFSNLFWVTKPQPKHHRAAVVIQRMHKQKRIMDEGVRHRAAARLQAHVRGMHDRTEHQTKHMPGTLPSQSVLWESESRFVVQHPGGMRLEVLRRAKSFPRSRRVDAFCALPATAAPPGVSILRDGMHRDVGILYTRVRPGHRDAGLHVAVARVKKRRAAMSLPLGMPPRPPTIKGAGDDFHHIISDTRRKRVEERRCGALQGGAASLTDAVTDAASAVTSGVTSGLRRLSSAAVASCSPVRSGRVASCSFSKKSKVSLSCAAPGCLASAPAILPSDAGAQCSASENATHLSEFSGCDPLSERDAQACAAGAIDEQDVQVHPVKDLLSTTSLAHARVGDFSLEQVDTATESLNVKATSARWLASLEAED